MEEKTTLSTMRSMKNYHTFGRKLNFYNFDDSQF